MSRGNTLIEEDTRLNQDSKQDKSLLSKDQLLMSKDNIVQSVEESSGKHLFSRSNMLERSNNMLEETNNSQEQPLLHLETLWEVTDTEQVEVLSEKTPPKER